MTNILRSAEEQERENFGRTMRVLGGIQVANRIAAAVGAEAMRALIRVEEEKLYRALGCETFVEFLNSEDSPVSKKQYYDRKALLEKEGDVLFDMLTEMGVSMKARKLLGKGAVEVADGTLIVHTDNDESHEIAVDNRRAMLDALSTLADANALKASKISRQAAEIATHDEKVAKLEAEIKRVRSSKAAEFSADAHMTARVEIGLAVHKLAKIADSLSDLEKDQLRDSVLEEMAGYLSDLRAAYRTDSTSSKEIVLEGDTFEEALESFLDNVDLNAANDGELAAAL